MRVVHYHYVFDDERERFARQLEFLRREFRPVPLSEAVDRLRTGRTSGDEVVVTFDDGFRNQLENAAPILAEQGFSACFFLVTGFVGAGDDEVRALLPRALPPPVARRADRLGRSRAAARARPRGRLAHPLASGP